MEYGRELDRLLRAEEQRREDEARRAREQREKVKHEADQVYVKEQQQREQLHRRRSMFEQVHRRNAIGMKDLLNWSTIEGRGDYGASGGVAVSPRLDHMIKVQERQAGDKGEYKSEHHARYFQSNDPEEHHNLAGEKKYAKTLKTLRATLANKQQLARSSR